jgi:hypothetical protein
VRYCPTFKKFTATMRMVSDMLYFLPYKKLEEAIAKRKKRVLKLNMGNP